jgi:hypothetical protein
LRLPFLPISVRFMVLSSAFNARPRFVAAAALSDLFGRDKHLFVGAVEEKRAQPLTAGAG